MAASPTALAGLDIEQVRVAHEHAFANAVEAHPYFAGIARRLREPDAAGERRRLMAESLRLSAAMAPEAHRLAQLAQHVLGVTGTLELYQRSGPENAAMHLVAQPILLEIHGSLLPRLDAGALLALFGHELGHYLAHGPTSPHPPRGADPARAGRRSPTRCGAVAPEHGARADRGSGRALGLPRPERGLAPDAGDGLGPGGWAS
jgi:hypothetical protein